MMSLDTFPSSIQSTLQAVTASVAIWLAWRVWRFTLSPALQPSYPRPLPYLIPYVGHLRRMLFNPGKLMRAGMDYVGSSHDMFSIYCMGEEMYVATSPSDIASIDKETKRLDTNAELRDILVDSGVTKDTVAKLFRQGHEEKSWISSVHDRFKVQMRPGSGFDDLQTTCLNSIRESFEWERISGAMVEASSDRWQTKTVSLWKWCGHVLVNAATTSFFGESIHRIDPSLVDSFLAFDTSAWKLEYRYPKWAAKSMYDVKAKCEATFVRYLAIPSEFKDDAAAIIPEIEKGFQDLGITDKTQRAVILLVFYRLICSNTYRLCFWCLAYILHNPDLLKAIKEEIRPAVLADDSINISYLQGNCPQLSSVYRETLRITSDSLGIRLVTQEVKIGKKALLPGRKLFIPSRLLHFDDHVFGSNATQFDPSRFLNNENLDQSTNWRPFGSGNTSCPGRSLAQSEVYMFIALALSRFDFRLTTLRAGRDGPAKFPTMDDAVSCGGILPPVVGDDVIVEISPRILANSDCP